MRGDAAPSAPSPLHALVPVRHRHLPTCSAALVARTPGLGAPLLARPSGWSFAAVREAPARHPAPVQQQIASQAGLPRPFPTARARPGQSWELGQGGGWGRAGDRPARRPLFFLPRLLPRHTAWAPAGAHRRYALSFPHPPHPPYAAATTSPPRPRSHPPDEAGWGSWG